MGKRFRSKGCGCGVGCGCGCCGGGPLAKLCLTLVNTIFLIFGVAVVYFGIWSKVETKLVSLYDIVDSGLDDDTLSVAGSVAIGFGFFVAIVSALGILAVCCSRGKRLMTLYGFLQLVICICGIAAAFAYGVFKVKIDNDLSEALTKSLEKYQPGSDLAKDWDYVQTCIECCGVKGPKGYMNTSFSDKDMHVPNTCCYLTNSDAGHPIPQNKTECQLDAYKFQHGNLTSSQAVRTTGCYDSFKHYIGSNLGIIIGVGVAMSTLQILGICLVIGICLDNDYDFRQL